MIHEPDLWRKAPDWARYVAQNSDGVLVYFEKKPHARLGEGIWYAAGKCEPVAFKRPDWAKSCKERPLTREPFYADSSG